MSSSTLLAAARRLPRFAQQLLWIIACLALAIMPHVSGLPLWVWLLAAATCAWRLTIELQQWRMPPAWLRNVIAFTAMLCVFATYRTLNGLEAGSTFLVVMGAMKLLETRSQRDLTVVVFVAYFLLFASFLYNQQLLSLPYMLVAVWLLTATLMRIHQSVPMPVGEALRGTGRMLLHALPVAILLFLFFPRLPGQFWAMPARSSATTGLSDEMSPGDVSELSVSGAIAFRVKFDGAVPPPNERYWRGPVLQMFDGRTWRRSRESYLERPVIADGPVYSYRITLQPHQRNWVFAMDAVTRWPANTNRTSDYQLIANRPVANLTSFALRSAPAYWIAGELPRALQSAALRLPPERNPRSRQLARQLRAQSNNDTEFIAAVLGKFRNEKYFYTLEPPRLALDSVDDFLFNTRRGFCEHFASAFTVLARAANIPARVVTGYQGGEINPMTDNLVVRQSDAHAWAEVWLAGRGWTRVDPTAAVAPERIERGLSASMGADEPVPGRFFADVEMLSQMRQAWDAVNTFWNDQIVGFNEAQQRSFFQRLGLEELDWQHLGVGLVLSLSMFFALLSAWLAWLFRPRRGYPVVRIYERLCKQLAGKHLARAPHEGPNDYMTRVAQQRPHLAAQLAEMRALYVSLRYGPTPMQSQLSRLKFLVNQLKTGKL